MYLGISGGNPLVGPVILTIRVGGVGLHEVDVAGYDQ